LTGESHRNDSGQVFFTKEKSNNRISTSDPNQKNLVCKGHIRADCSTRKKKQQEANTTELPEEDEDKCDVLSITDSSVSNKIDRSLTLDVHNISVLIGICSPHTLLSK